MKYTNRVGFSLLDDHTWEEKFVAFIEKKPRRWGDRRDGVWVRDAAGLNVVMAMLYPKRTESEVYMNQEIDITELLKFIEAKNGPEATHKTTLFHCIVTMMSRMYNERRMMNRFIQGGRIYERDEIVFGFTVKRQFTEKSEESLMLFKPKAQDNLESISKKILGEVKDIRDRKDTAGIDNVVDKFGKIPRLLLMPIVRVVRWLDFWGKVPKALSDGDLNFATAALSNLGSIKCPSVYHHLSNYGTVSCFVTIGTIHKAQKVMPDGTVQIRDVVDIGATLDERIADGFYFARSFKLLQYMCANPDLLDKPLEEESGYEYK